VAQVTGAGEPLVHLGRLNMTCIMEHLTSSSEILATIRGIAADAGLLLNRW